MDLNWSEDDEIEVLYHGTKFKKTVDIILKEGFQPMTYFARDLNTAIGLGGKYVFIVAFLSRSLPDNWQVRCENMIPPERIIRLCKYSEDEIIRNKVQQQRLFDNALELGRNKPYYFKETKDDLKTLQKLWQQIK